MSEYFRSIVDAFYHVVLSQPKALALVSPTHTLSYVQLWEESGRVAAFLGSTGLQPGERVGICLPRSLEWIIALIGAWRAGMVITPLDLLAPAERLEWQLKHATLATVLGQGSPPAGIALSRWLDLALASDTEPLKDSHVLQEGDPAYLIFTSGSTGLPKGVLLSHRGLLPVLEAQIEAFGLGPGSRSLWLLSPLFDASLSDLGTNLLAGATLYLDTGLERDLERLKQALAKWQISHLDLPPSLLPLLNPSDFPSSFQTLILGGEPSDPARLRTWSEHFKLINVYGPTETTICASLCTVDEHWQVPLLGQPLPGFEFAVLHPDQTPVAEGQDGELWISGPGLALGYVNASRLTRERFRELNGVRFYRSGDRVQLLPGGEYAFRGRLDRQIKWHGQRLEPEEIEAVLLQAPGVSRVAVFLNNADAPADGVLSVAFQTQTPEPCDQGLLQTFLKSRLPDWMLPVRWFQLADWPLTATGKTDYDALQKLEFGTPLSSESIDSPEEALFLSLWREILHRPALNASEALGAHSLQKLEFLARCSLQGLHLNPERLNACDTVRQIVQVQHQTESSGMPVEQLLPDTLLSPSWQGFLAQSQNHLIKGKGETLLTGATGFLGRWLLRYLLEEGKGPIHCLVRARNVEEGLDRLLQALNSTGACKKDWVKRLVPWCGDLEAEQWGLPNSSWKRLALALDRIIHSGARVHLSEPYERLKEPNLKGTQTALKLQASGRSKALHYVSTLSVFVGSDCNQGVAYEDDDLSQTRYLFGGYAQSKWAAEAWLRQSGGQAGPLHIYRLGLITGDTQFGWFPEKDWFQWLTQGLVNLGGIPQDIDPAWALDLTPVDYAARALLAIAKKPMPGLQTFHLANPKPLMLGQWLTALQAFGVRLERLPRAEWHLRMQAALQSCTGPESASALLALCRLMGEEQYKQLRSLDLFQTTGIRFDTQNADALLHPQGHFCPAPEPELLQRYLIQMLN
ncbi:MAG: thioester reductase domain-containing protein [Candidatus Sericytochromatia bacterium]|nr:thioester reductase domain-containing protein [Candidatus Sericytochromatia bacterium]